jgi:hypothetical protein
MTCAMLVLGKRDEFIPAAGHFIELERPDVVTNERRACLRTGLGALSFSLRQAMAMVL